MKTPHTDKYTDYIEVSFTLNPAEPWVDLLPDDLAELGFESFQIEGEVLKAYIVANNWSTQQIDLLIEQLPLHVKANYTSKTIPGENWNQNWESNFSPVKIGNELLIRAPFHDTVQGVKYEVVMEPKMAFGTGHHDTTYQIAAELLQTPCAGLKVLDMGSGTGVLGILAAMRNAKMVLAVDIDPISVAGTLENAGRNNVSRIKVIQGEAKDIEETGFGLLLANINRNIIMDQMNHYSRVAASGATLITSGFYEKDVEMIVEQAQKFNFDYVKSTIRNNWAMPVFKKR